MMIGSITFIWLVFCQLSLVTAKSKHLSLLPKGYAPVVGECPADRQSLSRPAVGLSDGETQWLAKRQAKASVALEKFLRYTAKLSNDEINSVLYPNGSNSSSFGSSSSSNMNSINIGLAPSGGSFRAMLVGAGQLAALDNRTQGAFEHGLGGLLQASTYLAGLSGSGWLVGSLAMAEYPSIDSVLNADHDGHGDGDGDATTQDLNSMIWNMKHPFFYVDGVKHSGKSLRAWHDIMQEVKSKKLAGFEVSMTDFYARALARQLLPPGSHYDLNSTFSSLRSSSSSSSSSSDGVDGFLNSGEMPLPIMLANGKPVDKTITYENSTVFEMNPFEFGTWDPSGNTFVDMKYLGTNFSSVVVQANSSSSSSSSSKCVTNLDNAGYLIGVTSSLFDMVMDEAVAYTRFFKPLSYFLQKAVFGKIEKKKDHVAVIEPNPFHHNIHNGVSKNLQNSEKLYLVDGGEDQQKIPLVPLLMPERHVDIVFAYDMGAELPHFWPSGSSLSNTYERQFVPHVGDRFSMPYVPGAKTMQALNYTHRPAFFGCDARNLTSLRSGGGGGGGGGNGSSSGSGSTAPPPVVVYTANTKYSYDSNAPTYKFKFSDEAKRGHIRNGFETATRGNLTDDGEFAACVGCAVIRRAQERLGLEQSEQCKRCFDRYCWDGTLVE